MIISKEYLVKLSLIIFTCFLPLFPLTAQGIQNLNFEQLNVNKSPLNWDLVFKEGGASGYLVKLDSIIKQEGKYSLSITSKHGSTNRTFGSCAFKIPVDFDGSTITLKGYMKTESVKDGYAGLWLRIVGEEGVMKFNNMQNKNIKGTKDWKEYRIDFELPADATQIVFGGLLTGEGIAWFDNFQILIDGEDISKAKRKKPVVEMPDEWKYMTSSGISAIDLTDRKINDLVILGKVWGFLKYYHPEIAAGKYNWDYELFKVIPRVLDSQNEQVRNSILCSWVNSLEKTEKVKLKSNSHGPTKMSPDLSWISNSDLGDSLTLKLNSIKNENRSTKNYYVGLEEGVGNPKFKNENPYSYITYPDAGFRLLCLFRYWNMIQYYYPYKYIIGENWNEVLKEFIPLFINASNELDYKFTTLKLIARIHDTHANMYDYILNQYRGTYISPLKISFIENKAVVTGYYDQELGAKTGLIKGDVIEKVNSKSVEDIIRERLPYTPASNYSTQLREISFYLLGSLSKEIKIDWKRGDSVHNSQIDCPSEGRMMNMRKWLDLSADTCFKLLPGNISYLMPGSIKNEYLSSIMPEIVKTKGLIIDMRCYPSDFIVFTLSAYLEPKKIRFVKFSNGSITTPGLFNLTEPLELGRKNKDAFKGKVVIIVNELTQSNAEYTTMAFRTIPGSIVIGSTTAGADGNVSQIVLPGDIHTAISGIGVYYPDGRETQRVGIIPDIEVKPTIKGIKEGKDELLEKAIEIINGK
jgi:hypothetical protein